MDEEKKDNFISHLLSSYSGRDSIIRTISYVSLFISGNTKGSAAKKFKAIYKDLSHCRLILRLFDDYPMLKFTMRYGIGQKENNFLLQFLGVTKNVLDQLYYPVEHIAWAADHEFVQLNSGIFYTLGTALWGLSSYIGVLRSLIMMSILENKTKGLKNSDLQEKITKQQLELLLLAIKDLLDATLAVHFLPPGSLLWAGKLDKGKVGLIGTVSSLLRLVILLQQENTFQ